MGILVENRFPQGSMQSPGDGVVLNEYFSSSYCGEIAGAREFRKVNSIISALQKISRSEGKEWSDKLR